jgi:hypothetical protein
MTTQFFRLLLFTIIGNKINCITNCQRIKSKFMVKWSNFSYKNRFHDYFFALIGKLQKNNF